MDFNLRVELAWTGVRAVRTVRTVSDRYVRMRIPMPSCPMVCQILLLGAVRLLSEEELLLPPRTWICVGCGERGVKLRRGILMPPINTTIHAWFSRIYLGLYLCRDLDSSNNNNNNNNKCLPCLTAASSNCCLFCCCFVVCFFVLPAKKSGEPLFQIRQSVRGEDISLWPLRFWSC